MPPRLSQRELKALIEPGPGNRGRAKPKNLEEELQKKVIREIKFRWPELRDCIHAGSLSGMKQSASRGKRAKDMGHAAGFPDLGIYISRGVYSTIYLELKYDNAYPFRKDGSLRKDEHIENQARWLMRLREAGHYADFAVGYEESIRKIDAYINLQPGENLDHMMYKWSA